MTAARAWSPPAVGVIGAGVLAAHPAARAVVVAGRGDHPGTPVVVIAVGRSRDPATVGVGVAGGGAIAPRGDPGPRSVIISVRSAVHPGAVAVVIALSVRASDGVGVPLAVAIVIAIGVGTVAAGRRDLVADHRTADAANDSAFGVRAASGDGAAEQGADAGAHNGSGDLIAPLVLAGLLSGRD